MSSYTRVTVPLIRFLTIARLWHPKRKDLNKIHTNIFLSNFSAFYRFFMAFSLIMINDTNGLSYKLYMSLRELALAFKEYNLLIRNNELQFLLDWLNSFCLEADEELQIIKNRLTFSIRVALFYYAISNIAVSSENVPTFFTSEWKLTYSSSYPGLDRQHNRRCFLIVATCAYQYFGILVTRNSDLSTVLFH